MKAILKAAWPCVLACLLYIVLCAGNLTQSVWFDESFSAFTIRATPREMLEITAHDVHPPLYYLLLKPWGLVFGHSDIALRAMSILFGVVAIVFAFLWLRRKFSTKVAGFAIFFLALSPILIRFGQEMRMYTLLVAIVFAATYFLERALEQQRRRDWIIYAALVALGMYTHYFAFLAWLAHLAYLVIAHRPQLKRALLYYGLSVLLYLPWLPFLLKHIFDVQSLGFWPEQLTVVTPLDYLTRSLVYLGASETTDYLAIMLLGWIVGLVYLALKLQKKAKASFGKLRPLLYLALVAPLALILLSLPPFEPMFVQRYIIYAAVALVLFAGALVALARQEQIRGWWAFALLSVGLALAGIINVYDPTNNLSEPDSKVAYLTATAHSFAGEPILAQSSDMFYDLAFYATPEHPAFYNDEWVSYGFGPTEPLRFVDDGKISDFRAWLAENPTFWYLTRTMDESWRDNFADYGGTLTVRQAHTAAASEPNKYHYQVLELQWQP